MIWTPSFFAVLWKDGQPPPRPMKQRELMTNSYAMARKTLLETMDEHQAGILFSCGGTGAGGFLMQQSDAQVLMDDNRFEIACLSYGWWTQASRWISHAVPI